MVTTANSAAQVILGLRCTPPCTPLILLAKSRLLGTFGLLVILRMLVRQPKVAASEVPTGVTVVTFKGNHARPRHLGSKVEIPWVPGHVGVD